MAKKSTSKRTHVSPGIYYKETEIAYATKSLGITTLGLAGETVKGPAFQPISIADWNEFTTYFGGTNTEKFRGSQYPKYELPYIAKEYLKQSKQLEVVRTLGLSGVNAGPAWVITATTNECGKGFDFTQKLDESGNPSKSSMSIDNVEFTYVDNGIYTDGAATPNYIKLQSISPIFGTTTPVYSTVAVTDFHQNISLKIFWFDDNDRGNFDSLPEGIKAEFGTYDNLAAYMTKSGEESPRPFIYLDINSSYCPMEGKLTIISSKDFESYMYANVINMTDYITDHHDSTQTIETDDFLSDCTKKVIRYSTDDSNDVYYYVMIPFTSVALNVLTNNKITRSELTESMLKAYHYAYEDSDHEFSESGNIYEYTRSENKEVCKEADDNGYNNVVIAILRSRGEHQKSAPSGQKDSCGNDIYTYDGIRYYANSVSLEEMTSLELDDECDPSYNEITGDFNIDTTNYGKFTVAVDSIKGCTICGTKETYKNKYSVSLNPSDKNYIIKVLGTDPEVGDSEVYVEELYDVALEQLIYDNKINVINHELAYYPAVTIIPSHEAVDDLLTIEEASLTKKNLGKRYLYAYELSLQEGLDVHVTKDNGVTWEKETGLVGHIYTVVSIKVNGKKSYIYAEYRDANGGYVSGKTDYLTLYNYYNDVVKNGYILNNCVKVKADNCYYIYDDFYSQDTAAEGEVEPITLDFNNYKEPYRYASTPWIVSEMKGSGKEVNIHKLFRFHTISDGDASNTEVKISIENIDPENGVFDVVIRSFYDSDVNPSILERFGKCCLVPGESNYIGLKIGTIDGTYVSQSAYVTVEVNEDDITSMSIPCGFLGYPVRNYTGLGIYEVTDGSLSSNVKQPYLRYCTSLNEDIKVKKQYFGMSDLIGIDEDFLSYKGVEAYNDTPEYLTPSFHLDSRIINGAPSGIEDGKYYVEELNAQNDATARQFVSVDGVTGYTWVTVSKTEYYGDCTISPRIGTDNVMEGTIYEDKNARKFTVCFCGGWDGWDYYRTSRSNGDEFRYSKYKGSINKLSGHGSMFSILTNPEEFGFEGDTKVITSDYYAYLAAYKQLENPKTIAINLLATPGIDYVNQTALVGEVIDMVEEDRGDTLYVTTTPDKPFGAGESKSEMYTPGEAVANLEDTEIDTNYACTYYPWEQYYDSDNNKYIYLPVTLDVVRNMAYTDNIAYPWYASAGWNRGDVSGVSPRRKLKLGEQDTLYEGRINFVNSFAKEGDKIWGDKNLQVHDGIMNRISKRRLLIRLKTLLSTACIGLLFDPNDPTMVDTFKSAVTSVLEPIKKNRGITNFKIEVDDSDEARDRLELPAKIWIKPTQMLEYIDIELAVTPQGVQWN